MNGAPAMQHHHLGRVPASRSCRIAAALVMNNSNRNSAGAAAIWFANGSKTSRTWEAQGNASDRGRPPAGFGSSNQPGNSPAQSARVNDANRPPWARGDSQAGAAGGRGHVPPPRRLTTATVRILTTTTELFESAFLQSAAHALQLRAATYSPPSRSYPAPSRSYSAPAPSRSYSAPAPHAPTPAKPS